MIAQIPQNRHTPPQLSREYHSREKARSRHFCYGFELNNFTPKRVTRHIPKVDPPGPERIGTEEKETHQANKDYNYGYAYGQSRSLDGPHGGMWSLWGFLGWLRSKSAISLFFTWV